MALGYVGVLNGTDERCVIMVGFFVSRFIDWTYRLVKNWTVFSMHSKYSTVLKFTVE